MPFAAHHYLPPPTHGDREHVLDDTCWCGPELTQIGGTYDGKMFVSWVLRHTREEAHESPQ